MTEKNIDERLKSADPAKPVLLSESLLISATESKRRFTMPNLRLSLGVLAGATAIFIAVPVIYNPGSNAGLIELGGAPQQGAGGLTSAPGMLSSAQDELANKMMMPNPFSYIYAAGTELSSKQSKAGVYQLALTGTAKSVLSRAAKALSVAGAVFESEYSTAEFPTFLVGSEDGTKPSVTVSWNGTGNWWYNNPAAYPEPECAEFAETEDGSQYCSFYQEQKQTPELQPTKSEMISQAISIFSATGLKVSAADISTSSNEWGSSAFASLQIDGQDSPLEWSLYWSANGTLASASGHSVILIDKGDFQTISAREAVSRMSDWRYSGSISQSLWDEVQGDMQFPVIAYDSPMLRGDESSDSEPTPTVVTITVNKSVEAPMLIWDKEGNAWIVPGYILIGEEGWITPVFSLEDGIVELPKPVEISPMVK
ncbi:MAG: hypothetical protein RI927_332 [Actinomycetota bacterium]